MTEQKEQQPMDPKKQQMLQKLNGELQQLSQQYYGLQGELKEHKRVLDQLNKLDDNRVAYRLIGDVLAKQTVGEVKPVLSSMISNLENVCQQLEKTITEKSNEYNKTV